MAEGMERILGDPARRERLILKGSERIREFTWERTAETLGGIFEKCL